MEDRRWKIEDGRWKMEDGILTGMEYGMEECDRSCEQEQGLQGASDKAEGIH